MIRLTARSGEVKVTFALPVEEVPGRCSVVGDFNQWEPGRHELRRRTNGTRSASVTLPAGTRIQFRYLAENDRWFNDPDAVDFDGEDTVLTV